MVTGSVVFPFGMRPTGKPAVDTADPVTMVAFRRRLLYKDTPFPVAVRTSGTFAMGADCIFVFHHARITRYRVLSGEYAGQDNKMMPGRSLFSGLQ